jgi:hypothetical protein
LELSSKFYKPLEWQGICKLSPALVNKNGSGQIEPDPFLFYGWGKGSRTPIHGVRVRCPTIERSPILNKVKSYKFKVKSQNNNTIKRFFNQSLKIFDFKVSTTSGIGISSWDLSCIFLKRAFPLFNSSPPRIMTYRAFSLSALRI